MVPDQMIAGSRFSNKRSTISRYGLYDDCLPPICLRFWQKDSDGNRQEFDVSVGDKVLISKYGGTEVKLDGASHQLLREDDILGIIS